MREMSKGRCEHCDRSFDYYLVHSGFGDCSYAYCDRCGMTAILSHWNIRFPKSRTGNAPYEEIPREIENFLELCQCGGSFRKGSFPRCPNCNQNLSPELATAYIERNAVGTRKGWRWQRDWKSCYCIVVENKLVEDNFKS
jgi:phage FluMu protein Com